MPRAGRCINGDGGPQRGSRWAVGASDVEDRSAREEPKALVGRSGAAAPTPEAGAEISHPAVADPAPAVMWGHTVTAAPTAGYKAPMPPAAGGMPAGAATRAGNGARIGRACARQAASVGASADPAPPLMGGHGSASQRLPAAPDPP